ncbi:MAG: galactose ABC transporter substrate-binding protein [Clostridiales bacterium]|nr:galactose ABC transporter substrate-binding protein [Clostridiales bacterium]
MIKRFKLIIWSAALAAALAACSEGASSERRVKIGVTLYQSNDVFINELKDELTLAFRAKEAPGCGAPLKLSFVDAGGSQSVQNNQVNTFIAQQYDVICVNMVDRTAASAVIDKAAAAGVAIVFFNREPVRQDLMRSSNLYYVGAAADQAGEIQADIIARAWVAEKAAAFRADFGRRVLGRDWAGEFRPVMDLNGDAVLQYVMLEGEPGHQDALMRTDVAIRELTGAWRVKVERLASDTAMWQRSQAREKMAAWLAADFGAEIECVISNNDSMALGAIDALRENGLNLPGASGGRRLTVVGVDATKRALAAIREGSLWATVMNDSKSQAKAIADIAVSAAGGAASTDAEGFDGKFFYSDYKPVTAMNAEIMD